MAQLAQIAITCINAQLNTVVSGFENEFSVDDLKRKYDKLTIRTSTMKDYFSQQRGGLLPIRCAFFTPQSNPTTTVFYTNLSDGWVHLTQRYLAKHHDWEMYYININEGDETSYPSSHFFWFCGGERRLIICQKEEKWIFFQDGKPLNFEDTSRYNRHLKSERFNANIAIQYLRMAGWNLVVDEFWIPVGDVIQFNQKRQI